MRVRSEAALGFKFGEKVSKIAMITMGATGAILLGADVIEGDGPGWFSVAGVLSEVVAMGTLLFWVIVRNERDHNITFYNLEKRNK